jgi:hypothetical protein
LIGIAVNTMLRENIFMILVWWVLAMKLCACYWITTETMSRSLPVVVGVYQSENPVSCEFLAPCPQFKPNVLNTNTLNYPKIRIPSIFFQKYRRIELSRGAK